MKAFNPLAQFLASEEAQGALERFYTQDPYGQLFLDAMRYWALHVAGEQAGTVQDGARAACDMLTTLTMSVQNEKKQNPDGSIKGAQKPAGSSRRLNRKPPPGPALRGNPDLAKVPPVIGPTPPS